MAVKNASVSSKSSDVVAVFDSSGRQVFSGASSTKINFTKQIQYMFHPVEDGSDISDHKIVLPDSVTMDVILDPETYRDTYKEIVRIAQDSERLTVQTRSDTFTNMYIEEVPAEESTDLFDTVAISLSIRQVITESANIVLLPVASVVNPSDASTVTRGQQQGSEPQASVAARGLDSMREFFS